MATKPTQYGSELEKPSWYNNLYKNIPGVRLYNEYGDDVAQGVGRFLTRRPAPINRTRPNNQVTRNSTRSSTPLSTRIRRATEKQARGLMSAARNNMNSQQESILPGVPQFSPGTYNRSLEDFLEMARGMVSQQNVSQFKNFGVQEEALRANTKQVQDQIAGGYRGLGTYITEQSPVIRQTYEDAVSGVSSAAQQAQDAITQGTEQAQAQQQAILNRLGIGDANIVLANKGNTLEEGMTDEIAESAQRAQLSQNQLNSGMQIMQNYNTGIGTAAQLEGQQFQNQLGRDLIARLAEIADARRQLETQQQGDISRMAMELFNQDYNIWSGNTDRQYQASLDNYNRQYQADRDAMGYAQDRAQLEAEMAQAGGQIPEMNATQWRALGPAGQAAYTLQQSGLDSNTTNQIIQAITEQYSSSSRTPTLGQFVQEIQELMRQRGLDPIHAQNAASVYYSYFE